VQRFAGEGNRYGAAGALASVKRLLPAQREAVAQPGQAG
jgi:hypothetical protein